ncbi:MAG: response regulator transcription factor [Treponema sp.]|jgi:DNA-binding NarL/FixJ family response regulator|nr:response regulator transcription factor [Treponema sp.]
MNSLKKIAVMIVEDHPLFSRGLASLIKTQTAYTIVGDATNGAEAMDLLRMEDPDLAIVDLNLGNEEGLELIKDMKAYKPTLLTLVLSMHDERFYAERVIGVGANGYIMKDEAANKVLDAIHTVLSGKTYISEAEQARLCSSVDAVTKSVVLDELSDRQFQIFSLIGKGLGTREIAAKLNLSAKTVDAHKEHIKQRLHCDSAQELRQLAIAWINHAPAEN